MSAQEQIAAAAPESGLTAQDVASLKQRLETQLKALSSEDHDLRDRLASDAEATANSDLTGSEGAATAESGDEVVAQIRHERAEIGAVLAALDRIGAGQYGLCTDCGAPIGLARLNILPEASHCVSCQEDEERHHRH